MKELTICIDHLPYSELSPNSRQHWSIKARAIKVSREEAGWLAKEQWHDETPMKKARISYEFHTKDKRHRDLDNLLAMCKPWQDGIIDVGVLLDDTAKYLEIGSIKIIPDNVEKTIIRIEEVLEVDKPKYFNMISTWLQGFEKEAGYETKQNKTNE